MTNTCTVATLSKRKLEQGRLFKVGTKVRFYFWEAWARGCVTQCEASGIDRWLCVCCVLGIVRMSKGEKARLTIRPDLVCIQFHVFLWVYPDHPRGVTGLWE